MSEIERLENELKEIQEVFESCDGAISEDQIYLEDLKEAIHRTNDRIERYKKLKNECKEISEGLENKIKDLKDKTPEEIPHNVQVFLSQNNNFTYQNGQIISKSYQDGAKKKKSIKAYS